MTSRPMYIMGVFGFLLLGLLSATRQSGLIGADIIIFIGGVVSLGPFLVQSKLIADKQTGNITIQRRHISGLWRSQSTVPINTVIAVDCDFQFGRSASLVHLTIVVRNAKEVTFGLSRPHYAHGIKGVFSVDQDYREQHLATELEKFIGVYHPEDYME